MDGGGWRRIGITTAPLLPHCGLPGKEGSADVTGAPRPFRRDDVTREGAEPRVFPRVLRHRARDTGRAPGWGRYRRKGKAHRGSGSWYGQGHRDRDTGRAPGWCGHGGKVQRGSGSWYGQKGELIPKDRDKEGSGSARGWNLDAAVECKSVHLPRKEKKIKATLAKFSRISQLDFAPLKAAANKAQSETLGKCSSG